MFIIHCCVWFDVINGNAKGYNKIKSMKKSPFGYVFMDWNNKYANEKKN